MTEIKYERGSEWRKWDLHVHTPMSDGFKGDWKQFQTQLLATDCAVIGINDYCSVEGYKKIKNNIDDGTLDVIGIKLLPIVEMRMTDTVQNKSSKTKGVTHFNFHIIFSDLLSIEDIENFIKSLKCEGTKIGSDYNDKTKIKTKKVSFSETIKELNSDKKFTDKFLIWLPYDEYGGIDEIDPNSDGWIKQNYINSSDILGSSNKKQTDFFHWKSVLNKEGLPKYSQNQFQEWFKVKKPCIKGSDSHNYSHPLGKLKDHNSKPIDKYCWIKADPTFEGLKQIICEPEERVRIQANKPQEKSGYQVIKSIEINDYICKQTIKFNPNLNTIVGGRSTGKSTLLKLIAYKINPKIQINVAFIKELSTSCNIKWQDSEENISRDIEYFAQGYMHDLASNNDQKNILIEKIVKEKDTSNILTQYQGFCISNKRLIQSNIDNLFKFQNEIVDLLESLKEQGDKKGLEKEIKIIQSKIQNTNKHNKFSDNDLNDFEKLSDEIRKNKQKLQDLEKDKSELMLLKEQSLFDQSFSYRFNTLSDSLAKELNNILGNIVTSTQNTWLLELTQKTESINTDFKKIKSQIKFIKKKSLFKQGKKHLENNKQYRELTQRLNHETKKLNKIVALQKQIDILKQQQKDLFEKTIQYHIEYSNQINSLVSEFMIKHDDIEINIKSKFEKEKCKNILTDFVNLQSHNRQSFVDDWVGSYENSIEEKVRSLLSRALENKIRLKAYKNIEDFTKLLLTENWFSISYQLTYQNDTFDKMSDGKKAFVVLKLLLEFSDKKCPILIDQPEDSLDNRAIYHELVKYIKDKKKERQIILVTHNANIVVNADAEEVIVANQHGDDSENKNQIKFEYISGSLENSKDKDNSNKYILHSQGIREHVCEILEGGTEAFKKRENKYGIA